MVKLPRGTTLPGGVVKLSRRDSAVIAGALTHRAILYNREMDVFRDNFTRGGGKVVPAGISNFFGFRIFFGPKNFP